MTTGSSKLKRRLGLAILAAGLAVMSAGCRGGPPATPTPSAAAQPGAAETAAPLPAQEAVAALDPARGGRLALQDGTELSLPQGALSQETIVTLRKVQETPAIPLPYSLVGSAYEFTLDGGEVTGVALIRLPLPEGITPDAYDVAPYHWDGRAWERMPGRNAEGGVQFGAASTGLYALHGQWRLADATLAVIKPETAAGQATIPMKVVGQYRFSAPPATPEDGETFIYASIALKQDTSGGAGQVAGDQSLDVTVDEAPLWFRPAPGQGSGVVQFEQAFELRPGELQVLPGATTRLYAILTVRDSLAPTLRRSPAIDYTQILPIRAVGMEVVRPALLVEDQTNLRWHVRRDGLTFALPPAIGIALDYEEILQQGGLGEYRFTLESEHDGGWIAVSNDVTVTLMVPGTATPSEPELPGGTLVAITTPTPGAVASGTPVEMPATPTQRPTPGPDGTPTATVTASPPTVTPTPTRPDWASVFWADAYALSTGQCTMLHWQVENIIAVYLDGAPVTGKEDRQVCPTATTTYTLRIVEASGSQDKTVTITVGAANQPVIEFFADAYQINKGQCTTLRWRVTNVRAVYLNGVGVAGEGSQNICPDVTTDYELRVEAADGSSITRRVSVVVLPGTAAAFRFWSEQYSMRPGTCTTLHWRVENVREVYLNNVGVPGVGTSQQCPSGVQFYTLRALDLAGETITRELALVAEEIVLSAPEVIAQGIVKDVARVTDLDPATDGDQGGFRLTVDGLNVLFTGTPGWSHAAVGLGVHQAYTTIGPGGPVDWPISVGQQVEFRAVCDGTNCILRLAMDSYVLLRSE